MQQTVSTRNLNQASFLTAFGSRLVDVLDNYPNNTFVVQTTPLLLWWEKHIGLIPYRKFCNQRIRLKERGRKLAKLPDHFVGKEEGFKFGDIARIKDWKKND